MADYRFKLVLGTHLTGSELDEAAGLLSQSYSRWQSSPNNLDPVQTDTSPEVYARAMLRATHEVLLYFEQEQLCGVFVHALSPEYDRYPLRKLSYLGVVPLVRGYEAIKTAFQRYAAFVAEHGEDVVVTSDLDQATLNSLLEQAGFREVVDRNETYFLLAQLLSRRIFAFQKVKSDFVIDQLITLDGKAVRRSKKLYKLQTTPYDFHALYRQQQIKRIQCSVAARNLDILRNSLQKVEQGIFFVSSFTGTITHVDESRGGFDSAEAVMGRRWNDLQDEVVDSSANRIYLVPGSLDELAGLADRIVMRPGFFDFLCFCLKILGSFYVASGAPPGLVRRALERPLAPSLPLRYIDLIESVLVPDVRLLPGETRAVSDGTDRTAYSIGGPYADTGSGRFDVLRGDMVQTVLSQKRHAVTPLVYLGSGIKDSQAVARLFAEAAQRCFPVLVFDFGTRLTGWANDELLCRNPDGNPYFSIVGIRDFYQIPVMLEEMGLSIDAGIDLATAG